MWVVTAQMSDEAEPRSMTNACFEYGHHMALKALGAASSSESLG